MHKGLRKSYRIEKGALPSIEMRPCDVDERKYVGHWEDDSIVCSPTIPVRLRTTNERMSGVVFIDRADDRTMAEANRITMERFGSLPPDLRKTLTRDRGSENLGYEELQENLGIKMFLRPRISSWERGSNENTNGLIRRFFPKKTDFRRIRDEEIGMVERLLNSRPRKRLAGRPRIRYSMN